MKRLFVVVMLLVLLVVSPTFAGDDKYSTSGEQTATASVLSRPGYFIGIMVATDATNAVTVSIFDNATAATGTELIPTTVITTSATDRAQIVLLPFGVKFENGIYVEITTNGTVGYVVYYR